MIKAFSRYTAVGLLSRAFQTGALFALVEWLGVNYLIASLIAVAVVHTVAFAVHQAWTFKARSNQTALSSFSEDLVKPLMGDAHALGDSSLRDA